MCPITIEYCCIKREIIIWLLLFQPQQSCFSAAQSRTKLTSGPMSLYQWQFGDTFPMTTKPTIYLNYCWEKQQQRLISKRIYILRENALELEKRKINEMGSKYLVNMQKFQGWNHNEAGWNAVKLMTDAIENDLNILPSSGWRLKLRLALASCCRQCNYLNEIKLLVENMIKSWIIYCCDISICSIQNLSLNHY